MGSGWSGAGAVAGVSWTGVSVGGSAVAISSGSGVSTGVGVSVTGASPGGSGVCPSVGGGVSLGWDTCVGARVPWPAVSVSGVDVAPQAVSRRAKPIKMIESGFTLVYLLAYVDNCSINYIIYPRQSLNKFHRRLCNNHQCTRVSNIPHSSR